MLNAYALVMRQIERTHNDQGVLPLSWYDALITLHREGRPLRMHELADAMLVSRSATTRFVDRLEKAGYVKRTQSLEDKRGFDISLTKQGIAALREASPIHVELIERLFLHHLDDTERTELKRIMDKVIAANHDATNPPGHPQRAETG